MKNVCVNSRVNKWHGVKTDEDGMSIIPVVTEIENDGDVDVDILFDFYQVSLYRVTTTGISVVGTAHPMVGFNRYHRGRLRSGAVISIPSAIIAEVNPEDMLLVQTQYRIDVSKYRLFGFLLWKKIIGMTCQDIFFL